MLLPPISLDQLSHHQVQHQKLKKLDRMWNLAPLDPSHLARPVERMYCTPGLNLADDEKLWMFECTLLDPSQLCSNGRAMYYSASGSILFCSSGSILASFWLVLVPWLIMFHFFEPSVFRWEMYATKGASLCSVLMIRSWNEIKYQSNKTSIKIQ